MRTTINIDNTLITRAQSLSDIQNHDDLIKEALNVLIKPESLRQLAKLGGSEP